MDGTTITGTVTEVQHRINRTGRRWGTAAIDTEHGSTDVLIFPKYYAMFGHDLAEGAVVTVTGRTHGSDLFAWEITPAGCRAALTPGRS